MHNKFAHFAKSIDFFPSFTKRKRLIEVVWRFDRRRNRGLGEPACLPLYTGVHDEHGTFTQYMRIVGGRAIYLFIFRMHNRIFGLLLQRRDMFFSMMEEAKTCVQSEFSGMVIDTIHVGRSVVPINVGGVFEFVLRFYRWFLRGCHWIAVYIKAAVLAQQLYVHNQS